jgi:hypothetical protein
LEKKMTTRQKYPGTVSTPVQKEALAALEEIAASDMAMEQELADFTGNPSTPQEQTDYQELVTLLQSLDGPDSMKTLGYNRAVPPSGGPVSTSANQPMNPLIKYTAPK